MFNLYETCSEFFFKKADYCGRDNGGFVGCKCLATRMLAGDIVV